MEPPATHIARSLVLFDAEPIPDAAHGLQPNRIGWVAFDLAAQPVDLDVDGPLSDLRFAGHQLMAGDCLAGTSGENRKDFLFAIGEAQCFAAALQFAFGDLERVGAENDLLDLGHRLRSAAAQDIADPEDQLARIERLEQVVVGPRLEAGDAAVGLLKRG